MLSDYAELEKSTLTGEEMEAYWQLVELNKDCWRPEVQEWLHSHEAQTELRELLEALPLAGFFH